MKTFAHKIGAVFYVLWGLLHVAGASVLLLQANSDGATTALATIGSNVPRVDVPELSGGLATGVLAYYAWNLLWFGLLVVLIGGGLNWKNSRLGYWLNLAVVSAVDGGLVLLLVGPGYMALADGLLGVVLWIPAVVFSTLGLMLARPQRSAEQPALA